MSLILWGLALIAIAFVVALLPAISFIPVPILGDVLDVPIGAVLVLIGTVLILIGGIAEFIRNYWWIAVLAFIGYFAVIMAQEEVN